MDPPASSTIDPWDRLQQLFHEALLLAPADREAFARERCGNDAELREQLLQLLRHEHAGDQLETPLWNAHDPHTAEPFADRAGERCGPYHLLRPLGRGGMGTVWLAERADREFEQRVAVKLLHASFDVDAVARFRKERQLLAGLRHPNIAVLLDGGRTESDQPYLVMEHVDGVPIDEYCRRTRATLHARVELFLGVCRAVEHAHRQLVIHRDIKPSNILVTKDGEPKLLDFGIAKVLEPAHAESDITQTRHRRWTPRYSSPEQVAGGPLSTATDVYSLGVVLFELLTLRSPYAGRAESLTTLLRAVCDEETTAPSRTSLPDEVDQLQQRSSATWRRALRGDLDAIVLRCLAKDEAARYPSVERLHADLLAYLEGRDVEARSPGLLHRLARRARRHRVATAALVLGAVGLTGGATIGVQQFLGARTAWREEAGQRSLAEGRLQELTRLNRRLSTEKDEADRQRSLADERARDVQELATTVLFDVAIQASRSADTSTLQRIVDIGVTALERLRTQAGDDPVYLGQLATAYSEMGRLWSGAGSQTLGRLLEAEQALETSVSLAEHAYTLDPTLEVGVFTLARTQLQLGILRLQQGRYQDAVETLHRAYEQGQTIAVPDAKLGFRALPPHLAAALALGLWELGRIDEARRYFDASEEARRELVREAPTYVDFLPNLADVLCQRAALERSLGDSRGADGRVAEALELFDRALEHHPGHVRILHGRANALLQRADVRLELGDEVAAEHHLAAAEELIDDLRATDARSAELIVCAAQVHEVSARLAEARAENDYAERLYGRALATLEELHSQASGSDQTAVARTRLLLLRADLLRRQSFFDEAEADLADAAAALLATPDCESRARQRCDRLLTLARLRRDQAMEAHDPARTEQLLEEARSARSEYHAERARSRTAAVEERDGEFDLLRVGAAGDGSEPN